MDARDPASEVVSAARSWFSEEEIAEILPAVEQVLRSGRLILGEHTEAFEAAFRQYVGTEHAVAVSSCSAALQIVLRYHGIEGREVLTATNNFPGVLSAVVYEGGTPVLTEMDPYTFCLDTEDALTRINERTAGVIVVHLAGLIHPEIDRLQQVCRDEGIFLLEDASHAHGASISGRRAGSLSDAGCFSFYPTKIMTTSTGGMITTDDEDLAQYARLVRHHGQSQRRERFVSLGSDWCLSELNAILGRAQLARLEERLAHRRQVVQWYRERLAEEPWIEIPSYPEHLVHSYYKLPTLIDEAVDCRLLRRRLETEYGIQNGTIYDPPCHLQEAFTDLLGLRAGAFPTAERVLSRQLCLPIHTLITEEDVARVAHVLTSLVDECRVGDRDADR